MEGQKLCRAHGFGKSCDVVLKSSNKSGLCTKHNYLRNADPKNYQPGTSKPRRGRKPAGKEKRPEAALTPSQSNGHVNGAARIQVSISENACDLYWKALTFEQKAQLLFPPTEPA